jgi:hypothetical protein
MGDKKPSGAPLPEVTSLEVRAKRLLDARRSLARPYMVELFGIPKSGKTTVTEIMRDFFRGAGYAVAAPQEGARAVELPRIEPQINFAYTEYALMHARRIAADQRIDIGILDRAIMDGVVRMDFFADTAKLTKAQAKTMADYYLFPHNRDLFDAHICLMADPSIAVKRKEAFVLTKRLGATTNPKSMQVLYDAHERSWKKRDLHKDPKVSWIDSTNDSPEETAIKTLDLVLTKFERCLDK